MVVFIAASLRRSIIEPTSGNDRALTIGLAENVNDRRAATTSTATAVQDLDSDLNLIHNLNYPHGHFRFP